MASPEVTGLDRDLMGVVNRLGVVVEGLPSEVQKLPTAVEETPNLITPKLIDSFYNHMGKFLIMTSIIGACSTGGVVLHILRNVDNSFPNPAINAFILGASMVGGAGVGFVGGLIAGIGITGVGYGMERLEERIRGRK